VPYSPIGLPCHGTALLSRTVEVLYRTTVLPYRDTELPYRRAGALHDATGLVFHTARPPYCDCEVQINGTALHYCHWGLPY
jgi:hypothetical protein